MMQMCDEIIAAESAKQAAAVESAEQAAAAAATADSQQPAAMDGVEATSTAPAAGPAAADAVVDAPADAPADMAAKSPEAGSPKRSRPRRAAAAAAAAEPAVADAVVEKSSLAKKSADDDGGGGSGSLKRVRLGSIAEVRARLEQDDGRYTVALFKSDVSACLSEDKAALEAFKERLVVLELAKPKAEKESKGYNNELWCSVCEEGGELLACDGGCFRSFHTQCLGMNVVPSGRFLCERT